MRPGETIRFRLTLDQSILNRYAHPITKDALLEAIAEFSRFYQDAFLSHFPQGHPVANIPDTPHLILGGGTGFLSKTVAFRRTVHGTSPMQANATRPGSAR